MMRYRPPVMDASDGLPSCSDVVSILDRHRALLVRNANPDQRQFESLTGQFCQKFHRTATREERRLSDGDGYSTLTSPRNVNIFAHSEGAYRGLRIPDIGFMLCLEPPSGPGGETFLTPARETFEALPGALQQRFADHGVVFEGVWKPGRWSAEFGVDQWSELEALVQPNPYLHWERRGEDLVVKWHLPVVHPGPDSKAMLCQAILGHLAEVTHPSYPSGSSYSLKTNRLSFGDGSPIGTDVIHRLIDLQDALSYDHRWQTGDLLIMDNRQVMHGRRAMAHDDPRLITVRFGHLKDQWLGWRPPIEASL